MKRRRKKNPDALAIVKVGGAALATVGVVAVGAFQGWFGPGFSLPCLFGCTPGEAAQHRAEAADEQTMIQLAGVGIAAAAAIAGAGDKPGTLLRGLAYGGLAVALLPYVDEFMPPRNKAKT